MAVGQARRFVRRELSDVQRMLSGTLAKLARRGGLARRRLLRRRGLPSCRGDQHHRRNSNADGGASTKNC